MKANRWLTVQRSLAVSLAVAVTASGGCTTTILVVRHAERVDGSPNSPISPGEGQCRAEALAQVAGVAGVSAIYATQYLRTRQTAQPLADRLGLPITIVPAGDSSGLAEQIFQDNRGEVVVVVGHSDTIGPIIEALGGEPPSIPDDEYDNLFVVQHRRGEARTVHLKYLRYRERLPVD